MLHSKVSKIFFCLLLCMAFNSAHAAIRYVKPVPVGLGNGSSWANASADLQLMINASVLGDEIWVAAGTYIPIRSADNINLITLNNRNNAFVLKTGVNIYGGFNGTETLLNQRNWAANVTILSGEVNGPGLGANSYHVVIIASIPTVRLDGFHIQWGRANSTDPLISVNGKTIIGSFGGGIFIINSNPIISNCVMCANSSEGNGTGVYSHSSHCDFINCVISGNFGHGRGSAIYLENGPSSFLYNCTISGNFTSDGEGGVIYYSAAALSIYNSIIFRNPGSPSILPTIPTNSTSLIEGATAGNPLFVAQGTSSPSTGGNYRLQLCSPAIDAGNSSNIPAGITMDLDARPRIYSAAVDMGAYEKEFPILNLDVQNTGGIVYVDSSKSGNGSSWANALPQLAEALLAAQNDPSITQIWVAKGSYKPKFPPVNSVGCPADPNNINNAFILVNNVAVYGGFAGTETLLNQRNWATNLTILSGDIGIPNYSADNCRHVVISAGMGSQLLDGFQIVKGYAGGGAPVSVNGEVIDANQGGGMHISNSSPVITNCTFSNNYAGAGAVFFIEHGSLPVITNCIFSANKSLGNGAAFCNHSSASKFTNCLVSGNASTNTGQGSIVHFEGDGQAVVAYTTFAGNYSNGDGIIYNQGDAAAPDIYNSIIYGNGPDVGIAGNAVTLANCIVESGYSVGVNVNNTNPSYISPVAPSLLPSTGGNYRLLKCSPVIDAGNSTLVPAIATDLDGSPRIINSIVDMGAYEFQSSTIYATPGAGGIVYVDPSKNGNGSSWANAVPELSYALRAAKTNPAITQVWVAKGSYKPKFSVIENSACNDTTNRDNTFILVNNVKVYGGFVGTETLLSQRDYLTNVTTLSGDIGVVNVSTDNCYHVVISAGAVGTAELNGFTIYGGYGDNASSITVNTQSISRAAGAGLTIKNSSPIIANCTLSNNTVSGANIFGGAVYASSFSGSFSNCIFNNNAATGANSQGGGVFITASTGTFTDCSVTNNTASSGAGIYANALAGTNNFINCSFKVNIASSNGAGFYVNSSDINFRSCIFSGNTAANGGGIYMSSSNNVAMVNCLVSGNLASANGAGMYNGTSAPSVVNSTFAGNRASGSGGGIYSNGIVFGTQPEFYNCIVYGNKVNTTIDNFVTPALQTNPDVYYSIVQNASGYDNMGNNSTANPLFINSKNASAAPNTGGNYSLQKCSPAINTGNNSYVPVGVTTDLSGNNRILNVTVDRGAYENNNSAFAVPDASGIVYVDNSKSGNGSSWTNAVAELADALKEARTNAAITQVWVAQGTYYPVYDISFACSPTDERDKAFVLVSNVKVYGGFAGTETLPGQRNWALNETILSGDIGVSGTRTDNCYHVVVSGSAVGTAELNGFTISDAEATGAGTLNINSQSFTRGAGGGIYLISSSPAISNCIIKNNNATSVAGGMYSGLSSPTISNCVITGNVSTASQGGGIFANNTTSAFMRLYNCTISGNKANTGGGVYASTINTNVSKIYNCIIYGNETNAGVASNDLLGPASNNPEVYNSIIGNTAAAGPYTDMGGNSTANPLFIDPQDASLAPNANGNYRIQKCSPAINAGNNTNILGATADLDGNTRIQFTTVDMGAYEKALAIPAIGSGIVYVDSSNIVDEADGSSWGKALPQLADALKAAKTNTAIKEIWVAKGTYYPVYLGSDDGTALTCPGGARNRSFVLVNNVKVYGGFAGTETSSSQRDWINNLTRLSGDVGIANDTSDNCYHVVVSSGAVGTAVLDGFTITKGNASGGGTHTVNGNSLTQNLGGGIYNYSSSPGIKNCIFSDNVAISNGGALVNRSSVPQIISCSFLNNYSKTSGGGIYNTVSSTAIIDSCQFIQNISAAILTSTGGGAIFNSSSDPTISNCNFSQNQSVNASNGTGGAIYNSTASPAISKCNFTGNYAGYSGGAISNSASSVPPITDCLFSGNTAFSSQGGAIFQSGNGPVQEIINRCRFVANTAVYGGAISINSGSPKIANCVLTGNTASTDGGAIDNFNSTSLIVNCTIAGNKGGTLGGGMYSNVSGPLIGDCIIWGNTAAAGNAISGPVTATYSLIEGGYAGTGNINIDPLFISPQPASSAPTIAGDYRLQACSPALNAGTNALAGYTLDLNSNPRIAYTTVDMGSYEEQLIDLSTSTWKGVNTNWNDKLNWCGGIIPTATTNVIIPSGLGNYPIIGALADNAVDSILLANATSIQLDNTAKLTINGTYTNNGSTIINNGRLTMAGSDTLQTFPGPLGNVTAMNELEIRNRIGVAFDRSFTITGALIPTTGNINLNNNINITLHSDANATAGVSVVQPDASISYTGTGSFIVERFINTGNNIGIGQHLKSWQFLATPASGQTIFQSWQEGGITPPGYGTIITGMGTGFDITTLLPSMKYYNDVTNNWAGVTNTGDPLVNSLGYMLFVRGDRTVTTPGGTPNNTTLRSKGVLFTPTNPPLSIPVKANAFQSFGNPYASRISFPSVLDASTGINDVFYVWDPKLPGTYTLGGYQTLTGLSGYTPAAGCAGCYYPPGVSSPHIQSSQAVFVKGNSAGGNVNFSEYAKEDSSRLVNKSAAKANNISKRQFLYTTLFTNTGLMADGNIIAFEKGFGNKLNDLDAEKLMNPGENFGLIRDDKKLAVEAREFLTIKDTLFYYMDNLRKQAYQLRFAPVNMNAVNLKAFLIDRYDHTIRPVSLTDSTYIDFVVTADDASAAPGRFIIVFTIRKQQPIIAISDSRVKVMIDEKWKGISISPNPVVNRNIQLWFTGMRSGSYAVTILNTQGQFVFQKQIDHLEPDKMESVQVSPMLASGIYQLEIIGPGITKITRTVKL